MGIFSFFKKKQPNNDVDLAQERVELSNLKTWFQTKKSELADKESEVITQIQDKLNNLTTELNQEIENLEQINLDEKPKTEERVKLIVKGNLENYITHLSKLIENLKTLEPNIIILTEKINSIFSEFEEKSNLSYQKATFLIGEELAKTKTSIADFFKNLRDILQENQNLILLLKTISSTGLKLKESNKIKKQQKIMQSIIENQEQELINFESQIQNSKKEIEIIKNSKLYKQELQNKQEIQKQKQKLEKQIQDLKQEINFKELANIFHSNKKEMQIIKTHRENFTEAFNKDNGKTIISLLEDAKLLPKHLNTETEKITNIKQEIKQSEKSLEQKETKEIQIKEQEITNIKQEIQSLEYEKNREENKKHKITNNYQKIINTIKQELGKVNIDLE